MTTKEQALNLAVKILKDIEFWGDDVVNPVVRFIDEDKLSQYEEPYWLVSHDYGAADFGEGRAHVLITIDAETAKPTDDVITRSGAIPIEYDAAKDKYTRKK